jgi:hypothetical protein
MAPVVQSTSAVADNPTNFGLAFTEQVTAGNLLLCAVQANGKSVTAVTDTAGNKWALAASATTNPSAGFFASIWFAVANAYVNGLKVSPAIAAPQEDVHIHLYEVVGYDSLDQTGGNAISQTSNPFSISTSGPTKRAAEFVIALFNDLENLGIGPDHTWTGQAGNEGTQTTNDGAYFTSMFTEVFEVTSAGVQTATATSASNPESDEQLIATFYSTRIGSYWSFQQLQQQARYVPPRPANTTRPIYDPARLRRR